MQDTTPPNIPITLTEQDGLHFITLTDTMRIEALGKFSTLKHCIPEKNISCIKNTITIKGHKAFIKNALKILNEDCGFINKAQYDRLISELSNIEDKEKKAKTEEKFFEIELRKQRMGRTPFIIFAVPTYSDSLITPLPASKLSCINDRLSSV